MKSFFQSYYELTAIIELTYKNIAELIGTYPYQAYLLLFYNWLAYRYYHRPQEIHQKFGLYFAL